MPTPPVPVNIMKLSNPLVLCLPLLFAVAASAPAVAAQTAGSTTLELGYGTGTCEFLVNTNGVSVSGAQPGVMSANGTFGTGCPTGGGSTGPVAVSLTAPATADVTNGPANITVNWTATADVCRYDPQTALPAPLTNWPANGNACIGAQDCAQAHAVGVSLASSGTYTFGLTCTSGVTQSHPLLTLNKTASVVVAGSTPPPPQSCTAGNPTLVQQVAGDLHDAGMVYTLSAVPETTWSNIFGINWTLNKSRYYAWPGVLNAVTRLTLKKNQYLSLAFTVPSNYPVTNAQPFPYGSFATNASSNADPQVHWSVSITPDCGDFTQPAKTDPNYYCYADYSSSQGGGLAWTIALPTAPYPMSCNLQPGHSYFLNFISAPLNTATQPNNTLQSACPANKQSCSMNFQQRGSFTSGALIP